MASMKPTRITGNKSGIPSANTALTAVALQDHLSRSLSLEDPFRKKKINHSLPPSAKSHSKVGNHVKRNKNVVKSREDVETKEYALDPKPPPLTLAQKLGLVEAPEQLLTDKEWKNLKEKSNARQDSSQPCVICKEDFGLCQQVLLSCSHVFHRACLEAFERFSGRKSCPMCRKEQYQRRIIHEGAKEYRMKCATRIQAVWRGYIVRQWYKKLRQTVPPKDQKLRKTFYENKLQSITDRLVKSMEVSCQNVDSLLSEIDESIARNRHTMRQLDGANIEVMSEEDWEKVQLKALERCVTDCPICIMPLTDQGLYVENQPSRPTVLLSCSHVFHATCLEAFEEFSLETGRVCPVCRSLRYQKKML